MVNTKSFRILDRHALSTFTEGFKIKQIITKYEGYSGIHKMLL